MPVTGDGGARHLTRGTRRDDESRQLVLSQNRERLDGGLSYLQLPQAVATAARQLLAEVVQAYGAAEPLMQMSPAVVAAVVYIAARQQGRALSLGEAAGALDVSGPAVFKEFRWGGGCLAAEGGGGRQLQVVSRAGLPAQLCLLFGLWAKKERSAQPLLCLANLLLSDTSLSPLPYCG
jgi:hypothetical protein